jgi:hypothetical protein
VPLKKPIRDVLIPLLEFFVVGVIGGVAVHRVLHPPNNNSAMPWWNDPTIILAVLAVFTVLSIALYIVDKRYGRRSVPEGN